MADPGKGFKMFPMHILYPLFNPFDFSLSPFCCLNTQVKKIFSLLPQYLYY